MNSAVFLAAVFALSTLDGVAGEKQIVDVKELAGTWHGWVTRDDGHERATMFVSADGSYRSLTTGGANTEGKFGPHLRSRQRRIRTGRVRRNSPHAPGSIRWNTTTERGSARYV
jgi:hypothetical protein